MQKRSENFSLDFENRSEKHPEMHEMPNNASHMSDANATMRNREPPGQPPDGFWEKENFMQGEGGEKTDAPVFSAG